MSSTLSHNRSRTRSESIQKALRKFEGRFPQFVTSDYQPTAEEAEPHREYGLLKEKFPHAQVWEVLTEGGAELSAQENEIDGILEREGLTPLLDGKATAAIGRKATSQRKTQTLNKREQKIWEVVQRGLKGAQYCRELHNADVRPRKSWTDRDCPGTYPSAYLEVRWRQMVQDEKTKISRKAKLANH
jgi:hypothetical protein